MSDEDFVRPDFHEQADYCVVIVKNVFPLYIIYIY